MTAVPDSAAELLRRAADRLDGLDKAATPEPWAAVGSYVAGWADGCTCGSPGFPDAHERGCGMEQIAEASTEDASLIAVLRPVAAPLATLLRRTVQLAEVYASGLVPEAQPAFLEEWLSIHHAPAVQIARSVLGGAAGGEGL